MAVYLYRSNQNRVMLPHAVYRGTAIIAKETNVYIREITILNEENSMPVGDVWRNVREKDFLGTEIYSEDLK